MRHAVLTTILVAAAMAGSISASRGAEEAGPRQIEVADTNHYLKKLEDYADSLKGEKGPMTPDVRIALKKVSALRAKYPKSPAAEEMFRRARAAVRKLQGATIEITPEILAFRQRKKDNAKLLAEQSVKAWEAYHKNVAAQPGAILRALPGPDPEKVRLRQTLNRYVVLEGLRYPDDLFKHYGRQFIAIGSAAKGYYFVDVSDRSFIGAYEALRRYQRRVSDDVGDTWTVVGRITSAQVMVPESGRTRVGSAYAGWIVRPEAIYAPGKMFARSDEKHKEGGHFAGEDRIMAILAKQFTVRSVPADVAPKALVGLFVTALKERNYELYLACIDPDEMRTGTQREWLQRKYDIFQRRLSDDYVHVEVYKADPVQIVQGGESKGDEELLDEFLDDKARAKEKKHRLPRIERQRLWLRLYDQTGKVREAPKPLTLRRREGVADARWFVYAGMPF